MCCNRRRIARPFNAQLFETVIMFELHALVVIINIFFNILRNYDSSVRHIFVFFKCIFYGVIKYLLWVA